MRILYLAFAVRGVARTVLVEQLLRVQQAWSPCRPTLLVTATLYNLSGHQDAHLQSIKPFITIIWAGSPSGRVIHYKP